MSLIPSAPFATDTLLPCERILRQSYRSGELSKISWNFVSQFAIHARCQKLKQFFFLFERQRIGRGFDFSQRAHDGRLPREAEHAKGKSAMARDAIANTRGACAPQIRLQLTQPPLQH